ncbi:MAG: cytochrome C [Nitrospirae bacterium]|nr:cytochrome C [Nitrospirota bacterium]
MKALIMIFLLTVSAVIFNCAGHNSIARLHPVELETKPLCSECHAEEFAAIDHTSDYGTRHKFHATQNQNTCKVCHRESFCSDCHANKEELKPSDKFKDAPGRSLPHRGDYLTQHTIDGKINPAVCFKCHGRKNNERCGSCHR